MRSIGTETKVGIFVVLGIIALTYFTVRVGRIAVREAGLSGLYPGRIRRRAG